MSKVESSLQELEETKYWLELFTESGIARNGLIGDLHREADELLAMLVASAKTAKASRNR